MSGILGKRFSGWRCLWIERLGIMPCDECSCFDSATLSCNKDGHVITHHLWESVQNAEHEESVAWGEWK